jgi:uncharacterized protein
MRFFLCAAATLSLAALLAACHPGEASLPDGVRGTWQGAVTIDGRNLGIVVHFSDAEKSTLDIPSQHAYAIPLKQIRIQSPKVSFELAAGSDPATFRGTQTGTVIAGSFAQGGHVGTFTVSKAGGAGTDVRAAVADETRVVLRTPTGDIVGSLLMPPVTKPVPVILIISGGGDMDRNGNLPAVHAVNNSLLLLAEALRKEGFATIRYDKRGVGESASALGAGRPLEFSDLINDAGGWITNLKGDSRFTKVGVLGYDEGALVGMVAAENAHADAFVSLEGSAAPADVQLKAQLSSLPQAMRSEGDRVIDRLKAGQRVSNVSNALLTLLGPQQQPFLISKFRYDPLAEIARLTMPVLILQGTADRELSPGQAEELHKARPGSYMDLVSGMNHVLKAGSSNRAADLATYSNPDLPLDSELVQVLTGFLKSVLVPVTAHQ